jgi:rubrerythrin
MDIFDIAITMEVKGAAFYRDLAKRASSEGFKKIFLMLAEDEDRHKETFEAMKEGSSVTVKTTNAKERAADIFKQFSKDEILKEESELSLYEEALEIELKSIEYYTAHLDETEDAKQRKVIEEIIAEERNHYDLIDQIIIMVERPDRWIEQAEFGVREDY